MSNSADVEKKCPNECGEGFIEETHPRLVSHSGNRMRVDITQYRCRGCTAAVMTEEQAEKNKRRMDAKITKEPINE